MNLDFLPGLSQKTEKSTGLPSFLIEKELDKKSFFLSSRRAFFHRYADTGFKNKWTGLWQGNKKFLEFFAVKAFNEWLGENTVKNFFYDYAIAVHSHKIGKLEVDQLLWMPHEKPGIIVEFLSEKELKLEVIPAVNIRYREENLHNRAYAIEVNDSLEVSTDIGSIYFTPLNGEFEFKKREEYKEHYPSGEKQNYFLPGKIFLEGENPAFLISTNKELKVKETELEEKDILYSRIANTIRSDNKQIEKWFKQSVLATELLRTNEGFFAGLPWFTQYWARDTFWAFQAFLETGQFGIAKKILLSFGLKAKKGKIINFYNERETNSNSVDATLLYLTALKKYLDYTGDKSILKNLLPFIVNTISWMDKRDLDKDGFIEHDIHAKETWMDTLQRNEKAIEVQALYYSALKSLEEIVKQIVKKEKISKMLKKQLSRIKEDFPHYFRTKQGYYADRILSHTKDSTLTPNFLVPHIFNLIKSHKDLNLCWSYRFMTKKGITSINKESPKFNPNSYHQGQVWSLTLAWLSMAEYAANRQKKGFKALKMLCKNFEEEALGCITETWNPETLQATGCLNQLWGSAMPTRIIDEFVLGLKANAKKMKVTLNPNFPKNTKVIERLIKLNGEKSWIKIEKKQKGYTAKSKNKQIKIEIKN